MMMTQKVTVEMIKAKEAQIIGLEEKLEKSRKINKLLEETLEKQKIVN